MEEGREHLNHCAPVMVEAHTWLRMDTYCIYVGSVDG